MSTRSNTIVYSDDEIILNMYRHSDGYLSGHGEELVKFLSPFHVIDGIGSIKHSTANGMGCLAAQIIARFKKEAGGIYIERPVANHENDYTYEIRGIPESDELNLIVHEYGVQIFSGDITGKENLKDFLKFVKQESEQ